MRPVHCKVHYGPTPQPFYRYDTFENRRFERLLKPVKAAIVYLQCIFRDSHCYFSSMRLKSGGTVPPLQKMGGTRTPPKVTPMSKPETAYTLHQNIVFENNTIRY